MAGRFIVVGDSFCVLPNTAVNCWLQQAAHQLGRPLQVEALMGVSQDWQWWQLMRLMPTLTPLDRVLVVQTHCERVWFVEDQPEYTHAQVSDLPQQIGEARAEAVRQYILHIQRPQLDLQHQSQRLGWLSAQVHQRNLHPVWVLPAFPLAWTLHGVRAPDAAWEEYCLRGYPHLHLTEQNLMESVQRPEYAVGLTTNDVMMGVDVRYNHMCLHNHKILAEKVVQAIQQNKPIDLESDQWLTGVLHANIFKNQEFCDAQLDPQALQKRNQLLKDNPQNILEQSWTNRLWNRFK